MKISPLVLLLTGALVGALAWGNCNAGKASDAQKSLQNALQAHRDSLAQWQIERGALSLTADSLRTALVPLREAYKVSRVLGQRGRDSLTKLLALLPGSQRAPFEPVILTLTTEAAACHDLLVNCELRAFNAEARAHGDSLQLVTLQRFVSDSLEPAWQRAEQKARPSWLRDVWRSRSVTLPLAALSAFLLVTKH